jgi:CubicO group peptidase (beta-lactamase class C family)
LLAFLFLAGGLFSTSAEQNAGTALSFTPSQLAAIAREASEAVEETLQGTGASAASVALGDAGGTVWEAQFGLADREAGKAPGPDTMFGIGSTSKMFATAATMILVDRGLVGLDVPLVRYLPEFRMATPGYEKITVRMLLDHSAGFPGTDYRNGVTRAPIPGYAAQVQASLASSRLKHEPGWMHVYANDGFTMVENLVKRMTGIDFPAFVEKEILQPLGMGHSHYPLAPFGEGSFAKPYKGDSPLKQEYLGPLGSGGLYSTTSDLTRFAAMLIGKGSLGGSKILSPASVAAMGVDQTAGHFAPLSSGYFRNGLGWDSVDEEGLAALGFKAWEKGGDTNSYGSILIVLPEEGLSVAVTGASGLHSGDAKTIAEKVLVRALVEKGRLKAIPVSAPASARPTASLPPDLIKNMPGVYVSFNEVYKVDLKSDSGLSLYKYVNNAWVQLMQGMSCRDDGWFVSSEAGAPPIDFTRIAADGRDYLAIRMPGANAWYRTSMLFGQKLAPQAPLSAAWQKRAGKAWLPVNYAAEDDYMAGGADPRIWLKAIDGVDGYVFSAGPDGWMPTKPAAENGDFESRSFILIPQLNGRDLYDVNVFMRDGEEWLRETSTMYRPLDSMPALSLGEGIVQTGPEGYAEWRRLPPDVRYSVSGAKAVKFYDANFAQQGSDTNQTGKEGGYLLVFGEPGNRAKISLVSKSASLSAEQKARIAEAGRKSAEKVLKTTGGSALTAAIVDENGLVWTEQFGFAEKTGGAKPKADTMFGIGSVSKMFATVSAMILVDRKLVNLDAPLADYLPEFTMADPRYKNITVRMIINHTAGLPGADLRNALTSVPFTKMADQVLQTLKNQRLKHEPGFMSVYANDGFSLTELLVEAVSGMPFTEFVHKEIFSPLGMTNSAYPNVKFPEDSYAHVIFGEEEAPWYFVNMYGTGALFSTPVDMANFAMMLASGGEYKGKRILSEAAIREMGRDQVAGTFNPLPSDYMRFGLGWDTVVQPGFNVLGFRGWQKGGDITGFYGATMLVLPDEHMAAIVAGASGVDSNASSEVAESLLLQALLEKGRLSSLPAPISGTAAAARETSVPERLAVEGYYANSGKLYRATFNAEGQLSVEQQGGGDWKPFVSGYTARADGWYSSDKPDSFSLKFINTEYGRYFGIRKKSGYNHYTIPLLYAQKLEAAPPLSEAWRNRAGETWLLSNESPSIAMVDDSADPRMNIALPAELPGYLVYDWDGAFAVRPANGEDTQVGRDRLAAMFLLIPGVMGRDLNDLVSETIEGGEYLRVGGARFSAASAALTLGAQAKDKSARLSRDIKIGEKGLAAWTKIAQPSEKARAVTIAKAALWRLYDESFGLLASGSGTDTAELPDSGSEFWIVTYAKPGTTIELTLLPKLQEQAALPPVSEEKRALLQATLEAGIAQFKMPGAIAGLWFPGKGEWVGTAGVGNPATGKAPGIDDKVRMGSVTKSFTATIVLQLVDEGLLSLDDPLGKWEPQVPGAGQIKVRNLLNMTSGLFNYTDLPEFWEKLNANPKAPWSPRQLVEMATANPSLFKPGEQYMYCNTNYILLGLIIEKVTGRTVSEEFEARIVHRLGLKNTSFPMTPEIGEPYLRGYQPADGEEEGSDKVQEFSLSSPTPYWTAGGAIGTLGELRTWIRAIATGELLSPEMHAEQLKFKSPNTKNYGLGVMNGGMLFGHSGEVPGYNSSMYYLPSIDAVCIVLTGRYPSEIEGASDEIMSSLIKAMMAK